mmetsp:Transcript_20511/g.19840  ORF Transcript_20511/g.19840 Transcript_20511/m.19840 type:complete len:539 (+) Transcript_20511:101-1717(+)
MMKHFIVYLVIFYHCASVIAVIQTTSSSKKNIVIIGGGWAGFSTAYGILRATNAAGFDSSKVSVTILEGTPRPGGLASGWKSANGKNVEAGIHGFWRCYDNIEKLVTEDLQLTGDRDPFTPWTPSALWTKGGLSVISPVFGDKPRLPTPLGTALFAEFKKVTNIDKVSAVPLALPWLDFDGSREAWLRYDKMTARELFGRFGMSSNLYKQFVLPLLLVLPMCPGEDCSAAAALSLFSYFALEHQSDFDVKWLKGSATELIFEPWRKKLEEMGAIIINNKRVTTFGLDENNENIVSIETSDGEKFNDIDAVISCTGISAAQAIIRANPALSCRPDFSNIAKLKAVDVVAIRMFLNKKINIPYPSNVGGGGLAPGLEATGLTFYDINALQVKSVEEKGEGDENSIIEVDFYYAQTLLCQDDETILNQAILALNTADSATFSALKRENVDDFVVVKVPKGVSHFAPGSYSSLPSTRTSVSNFYFAGDWIDRGGHKSWSQEKALVTGYQAAEIVVKKNFPKVVKTLLHRYKEYHYTLKITTY